MNRAPILVLLAVAVAGAGIYLFVSGGSGGPEPSAPEPAEPDSEAAESPGAPSGVRPELPAESPGEGEPTGSEPRLASRDYVEYRSDAGTRIRDHRNREVAVDPEAPVRRPFKTLDIEPKVVASMGRELRGVARRCRDAHRSEIGEAARVQPRVSFQIREGRLAITEAQLSLRNIPEDGEFASCVSSGAIGLTIEAPDHAEVERHTMTIPIDLDRV